MGGFRTGPIFINMSRRRYGGGGGGPSGGNGGGGGGCATTFVTVIAALIIFSVITALMMPSNSSSDITKSTVEREKLPPSAVTETAYFTDADGDWIRSPGKLERGLKSFYKATGVQPYVYILPNASASSVNELISKAEEFYGSLFTDEGHFILVFCDDGNGSYDYGYYMGEQVKAIMDNEAVEILLDYLDRYYNDYSIDKEEIFSLAFEKTGKRIMTVTKSPAVPVAICITVIIVVVILAAVVKKHHDAKEKERQQMEDILQTPLETFGDDDIEDLAKKYEDKKDDN